jgi:Flp pilus assembly pilin Flp
MNSGHTNATELAMRFLLPSHRRTKGQSGAVAALLADERGATAIEYTLIAALIVMSLVFLIAQIGDFVSTPFETIASQL